MDNINKEDEEIANNTFGWYWNFDAIMLYDKTLDELKTKIKDPEELYYFELFENSMLGKFLQKLTPEEKSALQNYTARIGSTFEEINTGLRNNNFFSNPNYYLKEISLLDQAISKFELTSDITLYRAVKIDAFKNYGINSVDGITNLTEYTDPGYMSCSLFKEGSYAYFKEYPILLEINVLKNTPGMYVDFAKAFKNQDFEFVLGRNTNISINGFRKEIVNGEEKIVVEGSIPKIYDIDSDNFSK